MFELHTFLLFIGATVLLVLSPGPDLLYILARTIAQGRKAGALAAIGVNAGGYAHAFAAVIGLSAIIATSSAAFTAIKVAGACYLVYIGVAVFRSKNGPLSLEDGEPVRLQSRTILWQGFLSDLLNPKVAVFFLAFLPQFVEPGSNNETIQLLILGVTLNVVALSINLVFVFFASAATAGLRRNPVIASLLNKAMGTVFIALGLRLANENL